MVTHADRVVRTVAVLVAMEAEAAPLVAALGLARAEPPPIAPPAQCVVYSQPPQGADSAAADVAADSTNSACAVHVVVFGKCAHTGVDNVGTVPAALTAYLALQALKPDLLLSAGTAGGFAARGAAIGDVFLATAAVNHDRRIPLPGFDAYGEGRFAALPAPALAAALGLKSGVVSSGNSLDFTAEDLAAMARHGAVIKEMEAAAVAWAASLFGVPLLCVKAVTDIVDGARPAAEEFVENLGRAAAALERVVPQVLEFVAGKRLSEL
jgi:5'-methylthioadenosine nucleosidase